MLQNAIAETVGFGKVVVGGVKAGVKQSRAPRYNAEIYQETGRNPLFIAGGWTSKPGAYVETKQTYQSRGVPTYRTDTLSGNERIDTLVDQLIAKIDAGRLDLAGPEGAGSLRFSLFGQSQGTQVILALLEKRPDLIPHIDAILTLNGPHEGGLFTNAAVGQALSGFVNLLPRRLQRGLAPGAEMLPGSPRQAEIRAALPDTLRQFPDGLVIDNVVSNIVPHWLPFGHDALVPHSSQQIRNLPEDVSDKVIEHELRSGHPLDPVGHLSSHRHPFVVDLLDRAMAFRQAENT